MRQAAAVEAGVKVIISMASTCLQACRTVTLPLLRGAVLAMSSTVSTEHVDVSYGDEGDVVIISGGVEHILAPDLRCAETRRAVKRARK